MEILNEVTTDLGSRRLECDNDIVNTQIEKELTQGIVYMVISLICGIVTGSTYAIASDEENQLVYIFPLCEEYFPTWTFIVEWGFRCSIIFIYCLAITSPSHYIIYGLLLIRLEEHRLLHSLRNVNQNYEKQEQLDLASQNIIKERLISCLKRHIHFSRLNQYSC